MTVDGDLVALDVVWPDVCVRGWVQRDPGPHRRVLRDLHYGLPARELRRVVVDVLHLHLDVDQFVALFGEIHHVKSDEALWSVSAHPLPVDALHHGELPVALPHPDERVVELFHHPKIGLGGVRRTQGHVLGEVSNDRARRVLLVGLVSYGIPVAPCHRGE